MILYTFQIARMKSCAHLFGLARDCQQYCCNTLFKGIVQQQQKIQFSHHFIQPSCKVFNTMNVCVVLNPIKLPYRDLQNIFCVSQKIWNDLRVSKQ